MKTTSTDDAITGSRMTARDILAPQAGRGADRDTRQDLNRLILQDVLEVSYPTHSRAGRRRAAPRP